MHDYLYKHYKLKDSIKEYKGYKVKPPKYTIKKIESYFSKINLNVRYNPIDKNIMIGFSPYQSGYAILYPKINNEIIHNY